MTRLLLALSTAALTVLTLSPAPAQAATGRHCIVQVTGRQPDGELITAAPRCYATFAAAMRSIGARVGATSTEDAAALDAAGAFATTSVFVLGIHYDGLGLTGNSTATVGSNCAGGYLNVSGAWNNRIRSTWNGCNRIRHFDGYNLTGAWEDTLPPGGNLTALDRNTSSIQYTT
jgi:hypothetical protein